MGLGTLGTIILPKSQTTSIYEEYFEGKIEWRAGTSAEGAAGKLVLEVYVRKRCDGAVINNPTSGQWVCKFNINGKVITYNWYASVLQTWEYLGDCVIDGHIATVAARIYGPSGTTLEEKRTGVDDVVIADFPLTTTIDFLSCATSYFDGEMTYKYTPKSTILYNRCNISLNLDGEYTEVKTINLGKKAASQQTTTVTLSESELSIIYNKLPSAKESTLRFTFRVYSDSGYSTQIGEASYKEITLTIPNIDSTQPTATMAITPVSNLSSPFNALYIRGKTMVTVNINGGVGKYGAIITSYTVGVGSASGYNSPYTSPYLTQAGEVTITGTVTDSRGYSRTYTQNITVTDYSPPQIIPISGEDEVIAARCDSSGNLSDEGTYLKIKAKANCSKVVTGGVQNNFCAIRYRYKVEGGTYSPWTIILAEKSASDEIITGSLLGGALNTTSTYYVQVQAIDTIGETATTTIVVPTDRVYMHKAGSMRSLGIGKYVEEENTVDIAEDMTVNIRGNFMFQGSNIADFPVEEGTQGIWTYRKWASGRAECWGLYNVVGAEVNVPCGQLFESSQAYQVSFPNGLFIDPPVAYYFAQTCTGGACLSLEAKESTTKDSTCLLYPIRATIATIDLTIAVRAIGRYK